VSALYVVLPLALIVSAAAVLTFLWALRRGQFDDLETPAHRILHDDDETRLPGEKTGSEGGEERRGDA
jgi:cbb3-type cytochrome oxidase maturation protein